VATDIAARGIDVDGISHVVNFDLPNVPETYVHRIGRTARAGGEGVAISLCDGEEVAFLRDIEKLIRMAIPVSERRTEQPRRQPPLATRDSARLPTDAEPRHRRPPRRTQARRRRYSTQAPRGIASVAFMNGKDRLERDRAPGAQRRPGHSQGS
jgi:ATP-dependent RNA helicase RhlE